MSLLEDVFLQDEADEAQNLERIIEGDEDLPQRSDSDNDSVKEDEAEEEKIRVDPTKDSKPKRVSKNPRFVLNPARLTGPRGIQVIPEHFKDFKFKGKGHEKEDLDVILKKLEHWAYRLYPKFKFEDCLKKIETLGKKRPVMVHLQKIRSDQYLSDDPMVQKDSSDDEEPQDAAAPEEDEFDRLLQQQIEIARNTPGPNSAKKDGYATPIGVSTPMTLPKATSSPSISEEQRDRILKNKKLAEERRLAKLRKNESNQQENGSKDDKAISQNVQIDLTNGVSENDRIDEIDITDKDTININNDQTDNDKIDMTNGVADNDRIDLTDQASDKDSIIINDDQTNDDKIDLTNEVTVNFTSGNTYNQSTNKELLAKEKAANETVDLTHNIGNQRIIPNGTNIDLTESQSENSHEMIDLVNKNDNRKRKSDQINDNDDDDFLLNSKKRKINRSVIDSSDDERDIAAVNQSVNVDIHRVNDNNKEINNDSYDKNDNDRNVSEKNDIMNNDEITVYENDRVEITDREISNGNVKKANTLILENVGEQDTLLTNSKKTYSNETCKPKVSVDTNKNDQHVDDNDISNDDMQDIEFNDDM